MSQPDELHGCPYCGDEHPARLACVWREPEPDRTCAGCGGDGRCHCDDCPGAHSTCEFCDSKTSSSPTTPAATLRSLAAVLPASTLGGSRADRETPEPAGAGMVATDSRAAA